jgi:t-SNARE complex subunit (syntaxin)
MPSDIREPQDDTHLHDDPAVLAEHHAQEATGWWDRMAEARSENERERFMKQFIRHEEIAREYREAAQNQQRIPRF